MTLKLTSSDGSAMNIVEIQHISKNFRTHWGRKATALRDVSLEVKEGEIFGLLGPNGAGKTTTFGILLGFQKPTTGSGRVLGEPLGSAEARRHIGFLSENPYFYDHLSAVELLSTFAKLYGLSGARSDINDLLERVGLHPADKKRLGKYSKGMRQRVGLAQAMMHRPKLLILDEPMSGLDPTGRREFRDIIVGLKQEGTTVVLASHVLSDVEALCDRVGFLIDGEIRKVGHVDELVHPASGAFEILATGLPPQLLMQLGEDHEVRHSGNCVIITVSSNDVARHTMQHIFAEGGVVLALRPRGGSLENVFVGELNRRRQDRKPRPHRDSEAA